MARKSRYARFANGNNNPPIMIAAKPDRPECQDDHTQDYQQQQQQQQGTGLPNEADSWIDVLDSLAADPHNYCNHHPRDDGKKVSNSSATTPIKHPSIDLKANRPIVVPTVTAEVEKKIPVSNALRGSKTRAKRGEYKCCPSEPTGSEEGGSAEDDKRTARNERKRNRERIRREEVNRHFGNLMACIRRIENGSKGDAEEATTEDRNERTTEILSRAVGLLNALDEDRSESEKIIQSMTRRISELEGNHTITAPQEPQEQTDTPAVEPVIEISSNDSDAAAIIINKLNKRVTELESAVQDQEKKFKTSHVATTTPTTAPRTTAPTTSAEKRNNDVINSNNTTNPQLSNVGYVWHMVPILAPHPTTTTSTAHPQPATGETPTSSLPHPFSNAVQQLQPMSHVWPPLQPPLPLAGMLPCQQHPSCYTVPMPPQPAPSNSSKLPNDPASSTTIHVHPTSESPSSSAGQEPSHTTHSCQSSCTADKMDVVEGCVHVETHQHNDKCQNQREQQEKPKMLTNSNPVAGSVDKSISDDNAISTVAPVTGEIWSV
mmetsp:Transcript_48036/g.58171  ORF Transcript_48036/g.58171 Transcript_48036/m.58171 type:complete len:547 (+) Transcript_48036:46-1686(+)